MAPLLFMPLPSGSALLPAGAILLRLAGRGRTAKAADLGVSMALKLAIARLAVVWTCLCPVAAAGTVGDAQEVPSGCRLRLRMRVRPARGRRRHLQLHDCKPF